METLENKGFISQTVVSDLTLPNNKKGDSKLSVTIVDGSNEQLLQYSFLISKGVSMLTTEG